MRFARGSRTEKGVLLEPAVRRGSTMENTEQQFSATPKRDGAASDRSGVPSLVPADRDHRELLQDVTSALASNVDLRDLVTALSSALRRAIPHTFMGLALHEAGSDTLVLQA